MNYPQKLWPVLVPIFTLIALLINTPTVHAVERAQQDSSDQITVLTTNGEITLQVVIDAGPEISLTTPLTIPITLDVSQLIALSDGDVLTSTLDIAGVADSSRALTTTLDVTLVQVDTELTFEAAPTQPISTTDTTTDAPASTTVTVLRDANLRSGPGTDFDVSGNAGPGDELVVIGQNDDGTWFELEDGSWIAASLVEEIEPAEDDAQTEEDVDELTDIPGSVEYTGVGDSVVDLDWEGPGLAMFQHDGSRNFIVETYDTFGERMDLLINTIGYYGGVRPLNFMNDEQAGRLVIQADGPWSVMIAPIEYTPVVEVPGTIEFNSDYIVGFDDAPDLLMIDATGATGNFIIYAYGETGRRLLVNDIAPYQGTVIAPAGTFLLEIVADGPFTIDVTD